MNATATTYAFSRVPVAPPTPQDAVLQLIDAQARIIESTEALLRSSDHEEIDGLLGDAMRKIAAARSVNRDLNRKKQGLPTIDEASR